MASLVAAGVLEDDVPRIEVTAPHGVDVIPGVLDVGVIHQGVLNKAMEVDAVGMKKHSLSQTSILDLGLRSKGPFENIVF